ncbi:hypothetical protein NKDENANG_03738 [Candidatus Entotheonellaceae bacterium PAL068K]
MKRQQELLLPALELRQGTAHRLYSFAVDGKLLPTFTMVSRLHQTNENDIAGYQRTEVLAHIAEIRAYLESDNPVLPTSIVIAFDDTVTFEPSNDSPPVIDTARPGILRIPLSDRTLTQRKPGWIVDGQQRIAAIREARLEKFSVFVTGFLTASDREQRQQFILVNSPKPLSRSLIYELLPDTDVKLPPRLQRRKLSTAILRRLNKDDDSPLRGLVQTPTSPQGVIKDNSVLRMLENSLSDGALYRFRNPRTGNDDTVGMLRLLKAFWTSVSMVFEDAWGLPPRRSRLMHGAGIIGVGLLMDAIAERYAEVDVPTISVFRQELTPLRDVCHWTEGFWHFADGQERKWNEVQNTSKDIQMLAMHLLAEYQERIVRVRVKNKS